MTNVKRTLLAIGVALLSCQPISANAACNCADQPASGWQLHPYLGGGGTADSFGKWSIARYNDGSFNNASDDHQSDGYRVAGGLDFLPYLGLEAGYGNFGSVSYHAQSDGSGSVFASGPVAHDLKMAGWDLSLIGRLPVSQDLSAHLRLGVLNWRTRESIQANLQTFGPENTSTSDNSSDLLYGAGLDYNRWSPWRLSLSATSVRFDPAFSEGARVTSASFGIEFVY